MDPDPGCQLIPIDSNLTFLWPLKKDLKILNFFRKNSLEALTSSKGRDPEPDP